MVNVNNSNKGKKNGAKPYKSPQIIWYDWGSFLFHLSTYLSFTLQMKTVYMNTITDKH